MNRSELGTFRLILVLSLVARKISRLMIGCSVSANNTLMVEIYKLSWISKRKIRLICKLTKRGDQALIYTTIQDFSAQNKFSVGTSSFSFSYSSFFCSSSSSNSPRSYSSFSFSILQFFEFFQLTLFLVFFPLQY